MKKYYDTEHDTIITETELINEYEELRRDGETDAPNFTAYVNECTGKNGTLEVIA